MDPLPRFAHHRLDAYRVAVDAEVLAHRLAERLPRVDADQLRRASSSVVRNIAEGANRWNDGEKRSRFSIARGEAGETAAVAESVARRGLVAWSEVEVLIRLEDRVVAMCTGLLRLLT